MLPLESFFLLLKEMEQLAIERSKQPAGRDAYELGVIAGMWAVLAELDDRLRAVVNQYQQEDDV